MHDGAPDMPTSHRGGMLKTPIRRGFHLVEAGFDRLCGASWNPLSNLGALGFYFYWVVAASGIYLYVFYDTGVTEAHASVEYLTVEQWYLGGVMRSLHRYASDAMVLIMVLHMVREFANDRMRGPRWFSWLIGVPILWLVIISGVTGYWLVWDELAQFVAIQTSELLDALPIFGQPIARNFLSPGHLDDRFFTLMAFLHIAVPLILLLLLWIHLNRVARPRVNPPRGLAVASFLVLMVISVVKPAVSQGAADLARVPELVGLDWFYLGFYPLIDRWSGPAVWAFGGLLTGLLLILPWLPPLRQAPAARIDLDNCNGCTWCAADCPYGAIEMTPRTDDKPFARQAKVDPDRCLRCGICVASCPTNSPFRRLSALVPGIDLPQLTAADLRERMIEATRGGQTVGEVPRMLEFVCEHGPRAATDDPSEAARVRVPCIGMVPPSFIDMAFARLAVDGVVLSGCTSKGCAFRLGTELTEQRLARERDPYLRKRVPRDRVLLVALNAEESKTAAARILAFRDELADLAAPIAATEADGPTPERSLGDA